MKYALYCFAIFFAFIVPTLAQFSGGNGSSASPYQVANLTDLNNVRNYRSSCFIQTQNIDASSTLPVNGGSGFLPIGSTSAPFTGIYDGNGYYISDLYIPSVRISYVGLFSYASGAQIKNLGIINEVVMGRNHTGGLVGDMSSSAVSNCYVIGSIDSDGYDVGGLVGSSYMSNITKCFSAGRVNGFDDTGGLVGWNNGSTYGGTISNCYSTRTVNGGDYVGGLVGVNDYNSTITSSYSTGSVSGVNYVGGLLGFNHGTVTKCFWDTEASGKNSSAGGTGKTTSEMKTFSTFTSIAWSFYGISGGTIWNIGNGRNNGYPYLQWQYPTDAPLPVELRSFTALVEQNRVILKWQTTTELNNYGFEVERNSTQWERIGFVPGHGNSNSTHEYSLTDDNPLSGEVQYRLKQIDNDGQFKYYDPAGVKIGAPKEYKLMQNSPNPFNPSTAIKFQLPENTFVTIKVYDLIGREIATLVNEARQAGSHIVYWNGNDSFGQNASSGIYLYKLNAGTYTETRKMNFIK